VSLGGSQLRIAIGEIFTKVPHLLDITVSTAIYRNEKRKFLLRNFRFASTLCISNCNSSLNLLKEEIFAVTLMKRIGNMHFDFEDDEWLNHLNDEPVGGEIGSGGNSRSGS
jgi:hypothetical protein